MNCPVCKTAALDPVVLESTLSAFRCVACTGHWIPGRVYWDFVHQTGTPQVTAVNHEPVRDSTAAKFCPECRHFMRRYSVGHGHAFGVDRCNACGGFWLDANEWEALADAGMNLKLHLITSADWEREVDRQERAEARRRMMLEKLGPADFAELERVTAWVDGHARKAEIYAWLLAGQEGKA